MPQRTKTSALPVGFAGSAKPESWPRPRIFAGPEKLRRSLRDLPGVGVTLERSLAGLGLRSAGDLLMYRPFRYEPAAPERSIAELMIGEEATIEGQVRQVGARRSGRRLTLVEALVTDGTDELPCVWFNQTWLVEKLLPGTHLRMRGQLRRGSFAVKAYDLGEPRATADNAPVYPASEEVSLKRLRGLVERVLPLARELPDPLPASLTARLNLPFRSDALFALHRPERQGQGEQGRRRLAFDELLLFQLALARIARDRDSSEAPALGAPGPLIEKYLAALPFQLTKHQRSAIAEIDRDLAGSRPMQRLLQGDVGSGKTVVALYALLRAVEAGYQGALMAPTETLAEQHFLTVEEICRDLKVECLLLTSALPAKEHEAARARIASGEAQIAIGTHALIQKEVQFQRLAVAVVDEQHRFGVEQRTALSEGHSPHVLHMSATPIPRTLALTLYGDLEVSEIAAPPAARKPVITSWVFEDRSAEAYRRLRKHLDAGRQVYVVCPLVDDAAGQARAAEQEAERLMKGELAGYRIGCMHGRLRPAERRQIMAAFKQRELDVLVATTVIEVGVDVPNATVMIIQEADRFGLAQLHQLRGRVGRGAEQSYCLLVSRPKEELSEPAQRRLEALVKTSDGFELAEVDLEIRGEGQFFGARQSGLSDFRFTRLRADRTLLEQARAAARELAPGLAGTPLEKELEERFAELELGELV
ncbi:MAG TPA: ATP-dependent DNA helicase RecG [Gaiellaceae bacterium]